MSIANQIRIVGTAFALCMCAVALFAMARFEGADDASREALAQRPPLDAVDASLDEIEAAALRQRILFERALRAATGRGHGAEHELRHAEARRALDAELSEDPARYAAAERALDEALAAPGLEASTRRGLEALRADLALARDAHSAWAEGIAHIFSLTDHGAIREPVRLAEELAASAAPALARPRAIARPGADAAARPIERAAGSLAVLALLLAVVGAGACFWLARRTARPLDQVAWVAEQLATGQRGFALPDAPNAETARLLAAMDLMMRSIQSVETDLWRNDKDLDDVRADLARERERNGELTVEVRDLRAALAQHGDARELVTEGNAGEA